MENAAVIKFGGSALELADAAASFAANIVRLQRRGIWPVVVHGGGKTLSAFMERLEIKTHFIGGLRYTDAATIELAQMVLAGKVNNDLVALIQAAGGKAVGLTASDGGLCVAARITGADGADLGFVGEVVRIDGGLLETLRAAGIIPVICSIARDAAGQALNCNADHVAAELARDLKVSDLVLLTDVDGVLVQGSVCKRLGIVEAAALLRTKELGGGMRPKVDNAVRAVTGGVAKAHIVNAAVVNVVEKILLEHAELGTVVSG